LGSRRRRGEVERLGFVQATEGAGVTRRSHDATSRLANASWASATAPHNGASSPSSALTMSRFTSGMACTLALASTARQYSSPDLVTPPPITKRRGLTRLAVLPMA